MRKEPADGLEPLALCHGGEVVGHGVGPAVAAQHRPEQKKTLLLTLSDKEIIFICRIFLFFHHLESPAFATYSFPAGKQKRLPGSSQERF